MIQLVSKHILNRITVKCTLTKQWILYVITFEKEAKSRIACARRYLDESVKTVEN